MNTLTSCGIAVIATVRAAYRPAAPPTAAPAASISQPTGRTDPARTSSTTVVPTATAIAAAETWLPRRAVAGEFIMCRPTTKPVAQAR